MPFAAALDIEALERNRLQQLTARNRPAIIASMDNRTITYTEAEFCKLIGISRPTAWRMREAGKLSYCKIGEKIIYTQKHVDEFLANCEVKAATVTAEA